MIAIAAQIGNPFPGLRPFEPHQSDLFFGRDEQIEELLDRLQRQRFLAVVGTSGSGKSSLVRAGLIPTLLRGYIADAGARWRIGIFRPGSGPMEELARALASSFETSKPEDVLALLRRSSLGLVEFARRHLRDGEGLLLVVDQFEELFRYRKDVADRNGVEESAGFVKLLLAATGHSDLPLPEGNDLPIYVVLTMRSDFLGKCAQFHGLPEALNDSQYLVPRMSREQQREVIEGPINMAGARISPQLVQRLLNDVGDNPDQLPVLQHAMMRTWEQASEARAGGQAIDESAYESSGEMKEALNIDAERAFAELQDDPERRIARSIFQRLVEPGAEDGETRRPTPLSNLVLVTSSTEEQVRRVIEVFRTRGFITMSEDQDPVVDITHESLIRLWKRLNIWAKEEVDSARIYTRLAYSAQEHKALYRDPELTEALSWKEGQAPNASWAERYPPWESSAFSDAMKFLEQSRNEKERQLQRRRLLFALLICVLIMVSALAALALVLKNKADVQAKMLKEQREVAIAQKLGAEADSLGKGAGRLNQRSLLLAIEALQRPHPLENNFALQAIHRSLMKSPIFVSRMKHEDAVTALRFSGDGKLLLSGSRDKSARVWEALSGKELAWLSQPYGIQDVRFSPSANYIAVASGGYRDDESATTPGSLGAWEWDGANVGKMLVNLSFKAPVTTLAFNPEGDGLLAADSSALRSLSLSDPSKVQEVSFDDGTSVLLSESGSYCAAFEKGSLRVIDGKSLQTVTKIPPVKGKDRRLEPVFLDDKLLAARNYVNDDVFFWNPISGKTSAPAINVYGFGGVNISANGELTAQASDSQFIVWQTATGKELLKGETDDQEMGEIWSQVVFSQDNKRVAVNTGDLTVRVYDVGEQREIFLLSLDQKGSTISLSADGAYLAVGEEDGTVTVWSLQSGNDYRREISSSYSYSPAGRFIAISGDTEIRVRDQSQRQVLSASIDKQIMQIIRFSQDDRFFAYRAESKKIRIYDLNDGRELPPVIQDSKVITFNFTPENNLVVLTENQTITKLNPVTGDNLAKFETGQGTKPDIFGGYQVIFSKDARLCAITVSNDEYQIWDVEKQLSLGKIAGNTFWGVHFSPDGKMIAALNREQGLIVYQTDPLKELWHAQMDALTFTFGFDAESKIIAVEQSRNINIWDAATGKLQSTLKQESGVENFAFSPDSKFLAATYNDGFVRIWRLQDSRPIAQIALDHSQPESANVPREILFSSDGKVLSFDDPLKYKENFKQHSVVRTILWRPEDLIKEGCGRLSRNLTVEEWLQYFPNEKYRKTCLNLP